MSERIGRPWHADHGFVPLPFMRESGAADAQAPATRNGHHIASMAFLPHNGDEDPAREPIAAELAALGGCTALQQLPPQALRRPFDTGFQRLNNPRTTWTR